MQEREVTPHPDTARTESVESPAARDRADESTSDIAAPRWLRYVADPHHAVPILLIIGIALYLVNLGGYPLYTKGEPREAVTVFDIVHGGGVILPQRAGVELPSKPLMMHWLAALISLALGGVSEFSVRLPSAALAIAGVIACFMYVRRLFDEVSGLLAALIMATTFQYLQSATGARVDMTLAFFMEVAFFEFILLAEGLTQRWIPLYVAIALAVLTKGPIGLILPGTVALVWIALERRPDVLRKMHLISGFLIVLVLAGGWYLAALVEGGGDFFRKQILTENLLRFSGGADFHEGHAHRFYYMELALMAGFMPWTILMPIAAVQATWKPRILEPRLKYVLVWFASVLIFYNFPQSKRGVYLLCLYPAFATLLALYVCDSIAAPDLSRGWVRWLSRLSGVVLMLTGTCCLAVLWMLVAREHQMAALVNTLGLRAPNFIRTLSSVVGEHWLFAALMPLALEAVGFVLIRSRPRIENFVAMLAAGIIFVALEVNVVIVPAIANTLSLKDFTEHAMKIVETSSVGYLSALNYDVAFYSRRRIPIVSAKDPAMPDYLIAWSGIFNALAPGQRSRFDVVIVSNPTSLDGSDEMLLLRRRGSPPPSAPQPEGGYIEARAPHDIDALRSSRIAVTSRGKTSAAPPRKLMSHS